MPTHPDTAAPPRSTPCACGYYNRERHHSRPGGGRCRYYDQEIAMPDDIDRALQREQIHLERAIAAARGVPLPRGRAGECDLCGEWAARLIDGACAPCTEHHTNTRASLDSSPGGLR